MKGVHYLYITVIVVLVGYILVSKGILKIDLGGNPIEDKKEEVQSQDIEKSSTPIFNLQELVKLQSYDAGEIDTYFLSKGYILTVNQKINSGEAFVYKYYEGLSKEEKYSITYSKFDPGFQSKSDIGWHTYSEGEYLDFKNQLKEANFEFLNSNILDGKTIFTYKKGDIWVGLQSEVINNKTFFTVGVREIK